MGFPVWFNPVFYSAVVCVPVAGFWLFHALSKLITGDYMMNDSLRRHVVSAVVATAFFIASLGFLGYFIFLFVNPWHG